MPKFELKEDRGAGEEMKTEKEWNKLIPYFPNFVDIKKLKTQLEKRK